MAKADPKNHRSGPTIPPQQRKRPLLSTTISAEAAEALVDLTEHYDGNRGEAVSAAILELAKKKKKAS